MIKVNGALEPFQKGINLEDLLLSHGYQLKLVAAERNGEIVPKAAYACTEVADGDCIEVVSFVGGG